MRTRIRRHPVTAVGAPGTAGAVAAVAAVAALESGSSDAAGCRCGLLVSGSMLMRVPAFDSGLSAEADQSAAADYCMPPQRRRRLRALAMHYPVIAGRSRRPMGCRVVDFQRIVPMIAKGYEVLAWPGSP